MAKKQVRKSHEEYLDDLGEALVDRGEFEAKLAQLYQDKIDWRKAARHAKWFSEDRYDKWSNYYAVKADICHLKKVIASNNRKIEVLEDRVASFGIPAPVEPEPADGQAQPAEAEVAPNNDKEPKITYFTEADFEDAD